ncbi:MAG: hypothetical protein COB00_00055 [Alcanivorax sp.]|nr:MAG: hypothetical protein COB00_00055 [Alcanivorax sp.]
MTIMTTLPRTHLQRVLQDYLRIRLLKPDTVGCYQDAVRRWINETGLDDLQAITADDVIDWRNRLLVRIARTTWNKERRHLRAVANHALAQGLIEKNPFVEVPAAPEPCRLPKTITIDLVNAALTLLSKSPGTSHAMSPRWFWGIVIRTFYFTGIRRSQLVGIPWRHLNLPGRALLLGYETSKTFRDKYLPIHPDLVPDLEYLYQRTREVLGRAPRPEEQVFNGALFNDRYQSDTLTRDQVTRFFQALSRELGQPVSAHRLRHTMATHLASTGQIRSLQEVLGHTSVKTTMTYVHPDLEQLTAFLGHLPGLRPMGRSC